MSAEINEVNGKHSVFTVAEPAWHGLGVTLEKPATAEEAIQHAGLDYEVVKKELYYSIEGVAEKVRAENKFATIRTDTSDFLGVVGKNYTVLQNKDAFGFFDPLVDSDEAIYHTAGALGKGERIWILAKMPAYIQVGGDDKIEQYVLLHNSHNGSAGVVACITPIRVVCNNTLTAALKGTQNKVTIRHTKNLDERLKQAHELLGITNKYKEELEPIFNAMAEKKITKKKLDAFFDSMYPIDPSKELKGQYTLGKKIRENIVEAFEGGIGQDLKTTKGTVFGLYNAVTYYTDHIRQYRTDNSKLNSVWFGDSADVRQRAFNSALQLV